MGQFEVDTLSPGTLRKYRHVHRLQIPTYPLNQANSIGMTVPRRSNRKEKEESLTNLVRRHFNNQSVKENDTIINFIYTVKNKGIGPDEERVRCS